jgi:hypothetical protein
MESQGEGSRLGANTYSCTAASVQLSLWFYQRLIFIDSTQYFHWGYPNSHDNERYLLQVCDLAFHREMGSTPSGQFGPTFTSCCYASTAVAELQKP